MRRQCWRIADTDGLLLFSSCERVTAEEAVKLLYLACGIVRFSECFELFAARPPQFALCRRDEAGVFPT